MRDEWYKLVGDEKFSPKKKEAVSCRRCGIIFEANHQAEICPACARLERPEFERVKDYLWENPGANMQQVAKACEVPVNVLRAWVREGKVELVGYRMDDDKL